jgi:hypothetical protein
MWRWGDDPPGRPARPAGDARTLVRDKGRGRRHRPRRVARGRAWVTVGGRRPAARRRPNALPEERQQPGWRRLLGEYRSYLQFILIGAAIVSLALKEWGTAVLLLALTVLNAVIGLRQEGKAESAMNALMSMMKATPRVRREDPRSRYDRLRGARTSSTCSRRPEGCADW